jgi:U6 snRNA-associated Sm-like protein LSm1
MMPPPPTTVRRMTAAHHVWTPEREQTLRAALRTAPCASRAGRRVLDDEWQFHIARALAAAEPPSSGWAPTGDAVKQHYQKRLPLTDAVKQHYQKRLPLTDDTRAGLPDRATGSSYPFLASESLRRAPGGSPATNPAPSKSPPLPPPSPLHAFSLVHMSFLQVSFFTARALSRPRQRVGRPSRLCGPPRQMTSPLSHLGLTGTASLAEELDSACAPAESGLRARSPESAHDRLGAARPLSERMLVQLRDGRKIIGLLRSFDQFANVVLEEAVERIIYEKQFADVPLGLYVIRGENVVLLGEMVRAPAGPARLPRVRMHSADCARARESQSPLRPSASSVAPAAAGRDQGCTHDEQAADRSARRGAAVPEARGGGSAAAQGGPLARSPIGHAGCLGPRLSSTRPCGRSLSARGRHRASVVCVLRVLAVYSARW